MASTIRKLDAAELQKARRCLLRRDEALAEVIRRAGPCRLSPTGRPYDALLRSVVHQQLAGAAARAIEARLQRAHGGRFPRPPELLRAAPDDLRSLGLSRRKAETLRGIAQAFEDGRLSSQRICRADDETVVERLTELSGVGCWTAHMILIFSLGRPDVLPVGDYGIRKGARAVYGLAELPGAAELERLAECWRPYRTVASWYLWRAADGLPRETRRPGLATGPAGGRGGRGRAAVQ